MHKAQSLRTVNPMLPANAQPPNKGNGGACTVARGAAWEVGWERGAAGPRGWARGE